MTTPTLEFVPIDRDEPPPVLEGDGYKGDYPDATPEAPYGYKADGTPYSRHHGPRKPGGTKTGRMPASETQARTATSVLVTINTVIGVSLGAFGMPLTAQSLAESNEQFTELAYQALLTDPALCKQILSAGATGGKAGLILAYVTVIMAILPNARTEITQLQQKRTIANAQQRTAA